MVERDIVMSVLLNANKDRVGKTVTRQLQQDEGEGGSFPACGRREATSCLGGCDGERTPAVRSLPKRVTIYNSLLYC